MYITKIKGKIVRNEECPLKKQIPCEECEYHDGWGVDLIEHDIDIYCCNPLNLKGIELSLTPFNLEKNEIEIENNKPKKRRLFKRRKNERL